MTSTKWCPHCQAERPLTEFYVNKAAASGIDGYCKQYRKEQSRERARRGREEGRAKRLAAGEDVAPRYRTDLRIDESGRQCARCEVHKPWSGYYTDPKAKTGHASTCIECVRRQHRERAKTQDSREAARRRTQEYRERRRGPGWQPSHVTRHAQLECDGKQHRCTGCLSVKGLDEFPRNPQTPCGFDPRCKSCRNEKRNERRQANQNGIRMRELDAALARVGLTGEEYLWLLEQQGGGCALCEEPETQGDQYFAGKKRLSVDHDHEHCPPARGCHECIRGLLCHSCNVGLGMFEGKPTLRPLFSEYLARRPFVTR